MSDTLPRSTQSTQTTWGIALAAGSLLLIAGGTVIWCMRDARNEPALDLTQARGPQATVLDTDFISVRVPPRPDTDQMLNSVAFASENGVRVVKIKVTASGDELVVDATTGRLLEARPSRPTPPLPAAKFAAPFDPMT